MRLKPSKLHHSIHMTHADGSASLTKRRSSTPLRTRAAVPPAPAPVSAEVPALEAGGECGECGECGEGGEGGSRHTRCCSFARRMSKIMSSRQTAPPLSKVNGPNVCVVALV